jgi:hypothetical protein
MRENRPSGLMRGGKPTVIGPRTFQSASCLLYTPISPFSLYFFIRSGSRCVVQKIALISSRRKLSYLKSSGTPSDV